MTEQKEQQIPPSIIELEWEEIQEIWKIRELLLSTEEEFKMVCLEYEKRKANAMSRIIQAQQALYAQAEELRQSKDAPTDCVYELKLPEIANEKAYFIRKDS